MAFQDILKEMVDGLNGALAAAVMGIDGIPVDQYVRTGAGCDIEAVGIEYGKVIEEVRKASYLLSLGDVREINIDSASAAVVIRLVTPEYYLALVMESGANAGKARYLLRRASLKTAEEL